MADAGVQKSGIEYVFDAKEALKMMNMVAKTYDKISEKEKTATKGTAKTGGGMGGGFGAMAVAKGMAIYNIGVNLLQKGFNALVQQMPFLQQGFDMAGKILMANLVYPLVQHLLPGIIRMFQWVRENRINFVKLGVVMVNVFKVAQTIISGVMKLLSGFWDGLTQGANIGQLTLQKFINFTNLLLLKIAFVFIYLRLELQGFFNSAGRGFGFLYDNIILPFVQGFAQEFGATLIEVVGFLKIMGGILDKIGIRLGGNTAWLKQIAMFMGKIVFLSTIGWTVALIKIFMWGFKIGKQVTMWWKGITPFTDALRWIEAKLYILDNMLGNAARKIDKFIASFDFRGIIAKGLGGVSGFVDKILDITNLDTIISTLKSFGKKLADVFLGPRTESFLQGFAKWIKDFGEGMSSLSKTITDKFITGLEKITKWIREFGSAVKSIGTESIDVLKSIFSSSFGKTQSSILPGKTPAFSFDKRESVSRIPFSPASGSSSQSISAPFNIKIEVNESGGARETAAAITEEFKTKVFPDFRELLRQQQAGYG